MLSRKQDNEFISQSTAYNHTYRSSVRNVYFTYLFVSQTLSYNINQSIVLVTRNISAQHPRTSSFKRVYINKTDTFYYILVVFAVRITYL